MVPTVNVQNRERFQATKRTTMEREFAPMSKTKGGRGDGEMLENRTNKMNQCLCTLPDAKVIKAKQSQISFCNKSSPGFLLYFYKLELLCF